MFSIIFYSLFARQIALENEKIGRRIIFEIELFTEIFGD